MTTTPAMPELPEPELGYVKTDKSNQPAFSARQMRAALQAQPAEVAVSDEDIWRLWDSQDSPELSGGPCPVKFARAILALRPQAVVHEDWPLRAKVWRRDSTSEWVLEISGTLCDTYMHCRHTQPLSVQFEDVPGLPTLYEDAQAVPMTEVKALEIAREAYDCRDAIRRAEAHHGITAPAGGEG